jgi:sulfide dehydrogenase cytochrome subunit
MRFSRAALVLIVLLSPAASLAASPVPPPGAAACSGCHGAGSGAATKVPPLVGQDPGAIVAAMRDFRSGKRPATVMDRIAKGFSDEETGAIAAWLAAQKN